MRPGPDWCTTRLTMMPALRTRLALGFSRILCGPFTRLTCRGGLDRSSYATGSTRLWSAHGLRCLLGRQGPYLVSVSSPGTLSPLVGLCGMYRYAGFHRAVPVHRRGVIAQIQNVAHGKSLALSRGRIESRT